MNENRGRLYLVPTPIGNLEDMTFRAISVLGKADLIACEDTRNTIRLLNHFSLHTPMTAYHEHNRFEKAEELIGLMLQGKTVAVVSDAGMPCVSDPGEVLVARAIEEGIEVIALPGANAALTALIASGMDPKCFLFVGFLPREKKEAKEKLERLAGAPATLLLYEAPHRLKKTLALLRETLGEERGLVLARELTKLHEEYERGTIGSLEERYREKEPRGEYVLVLEGAEAFPEEGSPLSVEELMRGYLAEGIGEKEAMKLTAVRKGIGKREVYRDWKLKEG